MHYMTFILKPREKKNILRGFGGSGGKRSMMTDRGGSGRAANRRITT
jgi:hypothetical protein